MTVSDTDNGYSCGCSLLGIISLGGFLFIANFLFFDHAIHQAKESESKQYINSMNRIQQAYYLENSNFTENIFALGLGIKNETENYTYSSDVTSLSVINYGISRKSDLKSYVNGIFSGNIEPYNDESGLSTIFCQAKSPGTHRPSAPIIEKDVIKCAPDTVNVNGENANLKIVDKDWTLAYLSEHYARIGEYNQALNIGETITGKSLKAGALEIIATKLAAAGKSDQAVTIVAKIQAIALELTDAGEYIPALRVTDSIPDDAMKSKTIQAIAPHLTTKTEYEQAVQLTYTITDYQQKAKALDAIIRRLVAIGEDERAIEIAKTIRSYYLECDCTPIRF